MNPTTADNFWAQSIKMEALAQMKHQETFQIVNKNNIGDLYRSMRGFASSQTSISRQRFAPQPSSSKNMYDTLGSDKKQQV